MPPAACTSWNMPLTLAWYARTVRVPEAWRGQRVFLVIGASDFDLPPDFRSNTQFGALDISADQPLSILALRGTINQSFAL